MAESNTAEKPSPWARLVQWFRRHVIADPDYALTPENLQRRLQERMRDLVNVSDYAVRNKVKLDEGAIAGIAELRHRCTAREAKEDVPLDELKQRLVDVETCYAAVVCHTHPITGEILWMRRRWQFRWTVTALSIAVVVISIWSYTALNSVIYERWREDYRCAAQLGTADGQDRDAETSQPEPAPAPDSPAEGGDRLAACPDGPFVLAKASRVGMIVRSIFAVTLGVYGALLYVVLNVLGAFKGDPDEFTNMHIVAIRLVTGGIVGWALYVGVLGIAESPGRSWEYVLAFLGGFSMRLVVGLLGKLIETAEQTFNLNQHDSRPGPGGS